jgi:hypothetical protein
MTGLVCANEGCRAAVPSSQQRRLYCSAKCKKQANSRADYERRREAVKASARRYGASERGQDMTLRRRYGITFAEREAIRERQGGTCVFCQRTTLYVDHCHDTGRIRGLLCMQHNGLLGHIGDGDPTEMNKYLAYFDLEPTRRARQEEVA